MTQGEAGAADPLVGQLVAGKYRIVRQLGEGGMGCVYLAEQQLGTTTRKVALKTLHKHLSHDPQIKARFDREAGTVAALEHPNTIQVFDFGTMEDGTLYLVMEFVQGRSVADILEKDGPMQPARVENILRQVCGSLEEAHSHGIVHRDLKPDNVVLCERAGTKDWVEVLDFGIAKRSSEHDPNEAKLTQQGMVLGTPPYMSPEQFTGMPVDLRSDIYALGIMTYEMLVGKYPFEANTAWEWASKHMTEAPRPIETQALGPNVPDRMRAAVTRALSKNKEDRFSSVKEFYEALSGGGAPVATNATPAMVAGGAAHPYEQGRGTSSPGFSGPGTSSPGFDAGRPRTEMAAPAYGGGPPPGGMTPPYGGPASGGFVPPIPPGPAHHGAPAAKKGNGLVIALAALAALLLIGGGLAFALKGKGNTAASGDPLADLRTGTSASVTAPVESAVPPATEEPIATAAPLGGTTTAAPNTNPTGAKTATPSGKATAAPVPTPSIKKVDPPICASAREAKARKSPVAQKLLDACRAAGGTP
ncbi:MAG: Serine/threonine protein kinase PrkC, regulator of stationary phase [Labilithrix sp.]|nr:Serine/threonine protein kinase PrkC, regulator of stationary phase [Labilithrix sp.]